MATAPRFSSQLTRHVEYKWRRDLTWQTIDLHGASLQDLLQAPVLVISGNAPLRLDQTSGDRLKEYVDQGGCILFEAMRATDVVMRNRLKIAFVN